MFVAMQHNVTLNGEYFIVYSKFTKSYRPSAIFVCFLLVLIVTISTQGSKLHSLCNNKPGTSLVSEIELHKILTEVVK